MLWLTNPSPLQQVSLMVRCFYLSVRNSNYYSPLQNGSQYMQLVHYIDSIHVYNTIANVKRMLGVM